MHGPAGSRAVYECPRWIDEFDWQERARNVRVPAFSMIISLELPMHMILVQGTPYANGFFVFLLAIPADYPSSPPKVKLMTTGGGKVGSLMHRLPRRTSQCPASVVVCDCTSTILPPNGARFGLDQTFTSVGKCALVSLAR